MGQIGLLGFMGQIGVWFVAGCELWVVDDRCSGGFVVVIIILFYFNLSRGGLVVVATVGGGWL